MTRAFVVLLLTAGCDIYGPTLLTGTDGGDAAPVEACATMCGSQCANLATDKNNCGACGTTCETGCTDSLCTPTVLTTGLFAPHGLLVHNDSLYFGNHGGINVQIMSKTDGTGLKNFATAQIYSETLATDGTNLYWTDDINIPQAPGGTIEYGNLDQSMPTLDCTGAVCYDVQFFPSPFGLAIHGQNMFVTTTDAVNNGPASCAGMYTNSVLECPIYGCNTPTCGAGGPTVLATGTALAKIAVDATNVYWADTGAHNISFCPQPDCAGGPKVFASSLASPFDVESDGTHVYFTDRSAGKLYSCPITGCGSSPTVLSSSLTDPLLVAFDAKTIYVTSNSGGTVSSCDLPTCAGGAKIVAKGLKAPYGIALDDTYVYWAEEGSAGNVDDSKDGQVSKLKRQ